MDEAISASRQFGFKTIASAHNCGTLKYAKNEGADYVFEHLDNALEIIDLSVIGTDKIVVSYSTITSAIHVAAYMGAANIILVGHACGTLDGKTNIAGYAESIAGARFYREFLTVIEPQTLALRAKLKEVLWVQFVQSEPVWNFGLEGHEYER
jgi:hypothetical protein